MSADDIRGAVARGDYAAASVYFAEYVRCLEVNETSLREVAALLDWTRVTVLCAKAHAADRLQSRQAELQTRTAYGR